MLVILKIGFSSVGSLFKIIPRRLLEKKKLRHLVYADDICLLADDLDRIKS